MERYIILKSDDTVTDRLIWHEVMNFKQYEMILINLDSDENLLMISDKYMVWWFFWFNKSTGLKPREIQWAGFDAEDTCCLELRFAVSHICFILLATHIFHLIRSRFSKCSTTQGKTSKFWSSNTVSTFSISLESNSAAHSSSFGIMKRLIGETRIFEVNNLILTIPYPVNVRI